MIRLCQARDVPFVRELAAQTITGWTPPTREVGPEEVQAYSRQAYADLEEQLKRDRHLVVLVEEDSAHQLVGYIMLDFGSLDVITGERQVFIVDLAVKPDRRGRFSTHRLIRKATELAKARKIKYLVGLVSVNNERTLKLALSKDLGFQIERSQVCKRL